MSRKKETQERFSFSQILPASFSYFSCIVLSFDFPFILLILLTVYHFHDKLLISSAAVAQEVAHLIGSEEVTGPSPVISFSTNPHKC